MNQSQQRPNIILIMTDQQRGDCLGIEGHPALITPRLDEIATSGVRFSHAYATCPSCIAARRSILSGQFPQTHGMVGFQNGTDWQPQATLPGTLSDAGYQTVMVGRSMHQHPKRKRHGYDQMILTGDLPNDAKGDGQGHGLTGNSWTARPWHLDETLHPTYQTVTEALHFMKTWRDPTAPLFMTLSFLAPHPPLCPPAFYMDRYLRMDLPDPVIGDWAQPPNVPGSPTNRTDRGFQVDGDRVHLTGEALRSCRAAYYALINHVDDQISRFLCGLGTDPMTGRSRLDNTIVLFTSDHGEMLGDHYLYRKTYPYEASARIPMMIQSPPAMGIDPGQIKDVPVCLEDIMPTLLDMAGVPIPDSVEGRSLLPLMQNKTQDWREFLHGEHGNCYGEHQSNHYLTDGRTKYVWYTHSGQEQLFDLVADPDECKNLAPLPEHAQQLALWHDRLVEQLKDRPEGFSDGKNLIAGKPHNAVVPR